MGDATASDTAMAAANGVTNAFIDAGKTPQEVGAAAAVAAEDAGGDQADQALAAGLGAAFAAKKAGMFDAEIAAEATKAVTAAGGSYADGLKAVQKYKADPNRWDTHTQGGR